MHFVVPASSPSGAGGHCWRPLRELAAEAGPGESPDEWRGGAGRIMRPGRREWLAERAGGLVARPRHSSWVFVLEKFVKDANHAIVHSVAGPRLASAPLWARAQWATRDPRPTTHDSRFAVRHSRQRAADCCARCRLSDGRHVVTRRDKCAHNKWSNLHSRRSLKTQHRKHVAAFDTGTLAPAPRRTQPLATQLN